MAFRLAPNGPQIKNQLAFTIIAEIVRLIRVVLPELAPHEVLVILARRQQARLAPITFGPGADRLTAPYTDIVKKKVKTAAQRRTIPSLPYCPHTFRSGKTLIARRGCNYGPAHMINATVQFLIQPVSYILHLNELWDIKLLFVVELSKYILWRIYKYLLSHTISTDLNWL